MVSRSGPSFESIYLQDVQSNKTCAPASAGDLTVNCTCFGRGGDVEDSCYDVSGSELRLVLGGESALWGEGVDASNLNAATFMATSVVAERLWSPRGVLDLADARARLAVMQEVMTWRGFGATGVPP